MKKTILIFTILFSSLVFSQSNFDSIPNIENNSIWLDKLEKIINKEDQIIFIIKKIKSDSIYKNTPVKLEPYIQENGHLSNNFESNNCKIIFALNQKKVTHILDLNRVPNYSEILKYLNSQTIEKIKILKGLSATTLFGVNGNCGVVYLTSNNKKLKRAIK